MPISLNLSSRVGEDTTPLLPANRPGTPIDTPMKKSTQQAVHQQGMTVTALLGLVFASLVYPVDGTK